jgi:hypothetical protein
MIADARRDRLRRETGLDADRGVTRFVTARRAVGAAVIRAAGLLRGAPTPETRLRGGIGRITDVFPATGR